MAKANRKFETETRDLADLEDIMSLTAEDIRAPGLYPTGPWEIRNVGYTLSDVEDKEGNPQKKINLRYEGFAALDGVDEDAVNEGGFEGKTLWIARWISKPAIKAAHDGTLQRFINFVEMHGVDPSGRDLEAMCKALKGQGLLADVGTRTYTNKAGEEVTDNTVANFASVE